uniref:Uncharacterized protein n=1 Tax=Anguilla anguilla TaxID=7936 RepID=A0A0E9UIX7_ANGAN
MSKKYYYIIIMLDERVILYGGT